MAVQKSQKSSNKKKIRRLAPFLKSKFSSKKINTNLFCQQGLKKGLKKI